MSNTGHDTEAPSSAIRDAAYDQIDRFLRNNLDDADYADYSQALDMIYTTDAATSKSQERIRELEEALRDILRENILCPEGGAVTVAEIHCIARAALKE